MIDLARKPVDYEVMQVGEELGPVHIVADDHFVKSAAFVTDDYHPWYFSDENPFGRRVVPPAILLCDLLRLLYTRYDPARDRGLHQKEDFRIHSPLFVGERVRLIGTFVDKFVRRERGYVVTRAEARTVGDDRLIISHEAIELSRLGSPYRVLPSPYTRTRCRSTPVATSSGRASTRASTLHGKRASIIRLPRV
jgi:acyl dehydratase